MIYLVISLIVVMGLILFKNYRSERILRKKLSVIESSSNEIKFRTDLIEQRLNRKLSEEQIAWKDKLTKEYEEIFTEIKKELDDESKKNKQILIEKINNEKAKFDKKVEDSFEKACQGIKFKEIVYKQTITKKRKEYNRKNSKNAKPQKTWRYLDEE